MPIECPVSVKIFYIVIQSQITIYSKFIDFQINTLKVTTKIIFINRQYKNLYTNSVLHWNS